MGRVSAIDAGMSCLDFAARFIRTLDGAGRAVPFVWTPKQLDLICHGFDGDCPEVFLHWSKKASKSTLAALRLLHHTCADPKVRRARRAAIASADEDQSRIIFNICRELASRHPWLSKHLTFTRTEAVYRDAAGVEHYIIALPRDVKGSHGEPWTLIVRDELWSEPDHTFSEALILDPSRPGGQIVYCTYHAPAAMMRASVPCFDLLQRVQAGDPRIFYSYIGGEGDDASWLHCPWISREWIEHQRAILASCPSKFRRVVLNLPAGADGDGLITVPEIRAALDGRMREPERGEPGMSYTAGLDLGLTNDACALVVLHIDHADGAVVVDLARTWRGTPDAPVNLQLVEDELISLSRRFHLTAVQADAWQAAHLVQRLQAARLPARTVGVEQARIDRLISLLKATFSKRLIRVNPAHADLIAQLESVRVLEARGARDRLRFAPSGRGPSATEHDDLVIALGLALEVSQPAIGRRKLPSFPCYREHNTGSFSRRSCFLFGGMGVPTGDASCNACPGWAIVRGAWRAAGADGGDVRTFYTRTFTPSTQQILDEFSRMLDGFGIA